MNLHQLLVELRDIVRFPIGHFSRRPQRRRLQNSIQTEVLEHRCMLTFDFGDAPEPYPVTLDEDGARHDDVGLTLGASRDTEANGVHSANSDADAGDDGVVFGTLRVGDTQATVTVNVQGAAGKLDAWIDFNGDGSWDGPFDRIFDGEDVAVGTNVLTFDVPATALAGQTYARFRLSSAGGLATTGEAPDGEVEDYAVLILGPNRSDGPILDTTVIDSAADQAFTIHTIDMDGDGDIDILNGALGEDEVAWYENDGSGNFVNSHVITSTADGVHDVFATDLDGDGDIDVMAATYYSGDVYWYENDGAMNFSRHVVSSSYGSAATISAADIDADGDLDLLTTRFGGSADWWENDGDESFTLRTISSSARGSSMHPADVNGDGHIDVVTSSYFSDSVAVHTNDGAGNFSTVTIATGLNRARSVYATDVDGDGDVDVLSASDDASRGIAWFRNNGNGTFTEFAVAGSSGDGHGISAADMDGDGDIDIVAGSAGKDRVSWFENDGNENFTEGIISSTTDGAWAVSIADLDGDGALDVASASRYGDSVAWHRNSRGFDPENPTPYENIGLFKDGRWLLDKSGDTNWDDSDQFAMFGSRSLNDTPLIGDWNGNGVDQIGVHRVQNGQSLFLIDWNGNGRWDGSFVDRTLVFGLPGDTPLTGDWNGDGMDEIGVHRLINGQSRFYLDSNGDAQWSGTGTGRDLYYRFGIDGDVPLAGDFNGDGTDSIGVRRVKNGQNRFYLDANGNGRWDGEGHTADLYHIFGATHTVAITGDWNGDGRDTIGVYYADASGGRFILDANGNGEWDGKGEDMFFRFGAQGEVPVIGTWV